MPHHSFAGPRCGIYLCGREALLRVAFIVRQPRRSPEVSVSNQLVHQIHPIRTIAGSVGGALPSNRVIDEVDSFDLS